MDKFNIPGISPYSSFSRLFQTFIQDVGAAKTKYEVDKIVRKRVALLKDSICKPNLGPKQMKEHLIELIYCEMLGHDTSFGHIHAVKFVEQSSMADKRIGYAAACLMLNASNELTLLLISTLQKDLKRSNIMEVSFALMAVCRLVSKEMIPAVVPVVVKLLDHKKELIRKKAVMALFRFYTIDPASIADYIPRMQYLLCDKDISVMAAALNFYERILKSSLAEFKPLTAAFVKILDQMIHQKLPEDFCYNGVPAPWIQIKLCKILAMLGTNDKKESEKMFVVLSTCLESLETNTSIACAVVYEYIMTVTTIYPMRTLIDLAERHIGRFLVAPSNNIKYLGITALSRLIHVDPSFAVKHQMTVIDCLGDPDETLKRKTLELLYKMTNANNVKVICERLINYLRMTIDPFLRESLVAKLIDLAYRYSPDNKWFIDIMIDIFELGGSLVKDDVAHSLMQLIGEGEDNESGDCDDPETRMQHYAVKRYLEILGTRPLPDVLTKTMVWVIGECACLSRRDSLVEICVMLCNLFKEHKHSNFSTLPWIVTAVTKIIGQLGSAPGDAKSALQCLHTQSCDVDVRQRCSEALALCDVDVAHLKLVLPVNGCCDDVKVDDQLSFLDQLVADDLQIGGIPYVPQEIPRFQQTRQANTATTLNFEPYAIPHTTPPRNTVPAAQLELNEDAGGDAVVTMGMASNDYVSEQPADLIRHTFADPAVGAVMPAAKQVWGPKGYANFSITQSTPDDVDASQDGAVAGSNNENVPPPSAASMYNSAKETASPLPERPEDERKRELASALFSGLETAPVFGMAPASVPSLSHHYPRGTHSVKASGDTSMPSPRASDNMITQSLPSASTHDGGGLAFYSSNSSRNSNDLSETTTNDALLTLAGLSFDSHPIAASGAAPIETNSVQQEQIAMAQERTAIATTSHLHSNPDLLLAVDTSSTTIGSQSDDTGTRPDDQSHTSLLDGDIPCSVISVMDPPRCVLPLSLLDFDRWERPVDVCSDVSLRLSLQLVYQPRSTVLAMFITNHCQHPLTDVCVLLQPPSHLKTIVTGDSASTRQSDHSVAVPVLDASSMQCLQASLTQQSPSLHVMIDGELSYKDNTRSVRRLFWNIPLNSCEFLRPSAMTIKDYEKHWPRFGYSEKAKVSFTSNSVALESLKTVTERLGRFKCVKVIGHEAIFAATVLDGDSVLLHVKHQRGSAELWVKSTGTLQSRAILAGLRQILATV